MRAGTLLFLFALGACSADVVGRAPALGDIVDRDELNVYQISRAGTATTHPLCAHGRCVDLEVGGNDWVCPSGVSRESFDVMVFRPTTSAAPFEILCGREVFAPAVLLGNTNSTDRGFARLSDVPLQCRALDASNRRFNTLTLEITEAGMDRIIGDADLAQDQVVVDVVVADDNRPSCPGPRMRLVTEAFAEACQPGTPPVCTVVSASYAVRPAGLGFATDFRIGNSSRGRAPRLEESTLRLRSASSEGLLREGLCPVGVCDREASEPTRWFPPHGLMRARFENEPESRPRVLGILIETGGSTYTSGAELVERSAPVRLVDAAGTTFSLPEDCDASDDACEIGLRPSGGGPWPVGLHLANVELTNDDSLTDLPPTSRLQLPAVTQSQHGNAFDRGPLGDLIGEATVSLVSFDQDSLTVDGAPGRLSGRVYASAGVPLPDRLEIAFFDGEAGAAIPMAGDGTFELTVAPSTSFSARGDVEVRAYMADAFVGYDRIPLRIEGPDSDGDGVSNGEDNCPDIANPDQTDLNPRTPAGAACEGAPGDVLDLDGDGLNSERERSRRLSDVLSDSDGDGALDSIEIAAGSDPRAPDSDGDGVDDALELADGNADGIADFEDPDNTTIGLDPEASVFLVEEDWTVRFQMRNLPDLESAGTSWNARGRVTFRLTYALATSSAEYWLSPDSQMPEPDHYSALDGLTPFARAFRLDSIGLSYLSDVEVLTESCRDQTTLEGSHTCDLVPVANFGCTGALGDIGPCRGIGVDAWGAGAPGATFSASPSRRWHVEHYPNDGWRNPLDTEHLIGAPAVVRSQPQTQLGTLAYFGGFDGRGDAVDTGARTLQVASARGASAEALARSGFTIGICRRTDTACGGPSGDPCESRDGLCDAIPVAGNVAWGTGIRLGAFGAASPTLSGGVDPLHAATWRIEESQLLPLLRGEAGSASGSGSITVNPSMASRQVPLMATGGTVIRAREFSREVRARVTSLGPVFVAGDARGSGDRADVVGTDRGWNGRIGHRAYASDARSASGIDATDWIRAHVGLAGTFRPNVSVPDAGHTAAVATVSRLFAQCRRARMSAPVDELGQQLASPPGDACRVHVRVSAETGVPVDPTTGCGNQLDCLDTFGPNDGVIFSESVPLEILDTEIPEGAARRGGLYLRWTGQLESHNTINTLPDETTGSARIAGCIAFPTDAQLDSARQATSCGSCPSGSRCQLGTCVPAGSVVHPGRYRMRVRFLSTDRLADAAISSSCSSSTIAPFTPTSAERIRGAATPVSIGYPVAIRTTSGTIAGAMGLLRPPSRGEDYNVAAVAMCDEAIDFWRDNDTSIDAFHLVTSGTDHSAVPVLPPYAVLFVATTSADAAVLRASITSRPEPSYGIVDQAAVLGMRRPALAYGMIDLPAMLGASGIRAEDPISDVLLQFNLAPAPSCEYSAYPLPPARNAPRGYWEGLPAAWTTSDSDLYGRILGEVLVHETGHLSGLSHVLLGGLHVDSATQAQLEPRCPPAAAVEPTGYHWVVADSGRFICTGREGPYRLDPSRTPLPAPVVLGTANEYGVLLQHPMFGLAYAVAATDAEVCSGDDVRGRLGTGTCTDVIAGTLVPLSGRAIGTMDPVDRHRRVMLETVGSVGGRQQTVPGACGPRVVDQRPSLQYLLRQYPIDP